MEGNGTLAGARILIVDDDDSIRELVSVLFKRRGANPTCASSALEACRKIEGGEVYDLVITDLWMPQMSGTELLQFMQRNRSHTPCIAMSAGSGMNEAVKAGACAFISKPFSMGILLEAAMAALNHEPELPLVAAAH